MDKDLIWAVLFSTQAGSTIQVVVFSLFECHLFTKRFKSDYIFHIAMYLFSVRIIICVGSNLSKKEVK
jgi:hypothetical protein